MWKWIGLTILVIIALVIWRVTSLFKTIANGGDSTVTTIAAPPDRVFAALANPDSMTLWMGQNVTILSNRHGPLEVGDTVGVTQGSATAHSKITWTVTAISPGQLLAMAITNDSTHQMVATQRDSLIAVGDSTMIVTTIAVPVMDSIRNSRGDSSGRMGSAVLDFGTKMMIGAFRKLSEIERGELKNHLEGTRAAAH